jgi:hypothetical protein
MGQFARREDPVQKMLPVLGLHCGNAVGFDEINTMS